MRTQETLGYVVQLLKSFLLEIPHLIGIIQSSIKVPEYCSQRVKNFYEEKKDEIINITDDEFNKRIKSLLVEEMRKDIKLKEQFERNWTEISLMRYKFNLKEENAEYLKKCTKEGFIQFYKKYMENDIKMSKVEYICDNHIKILRKSHNLYNLSGIRIPETNDTNKTSIPRFYDVAGKKARHEAELNSQAKYMIEFLSLKSLLFRQSRNTQPASLYCLLKE